jgi:GT2 family glycosyltransferase
MVDLSIIIVNYNTLQLLRSCLHSVQRYSSDLSHEVIVIDNGSTDHSQQMVADEYPHIHLICNAENYGFARANNQGLCVARGRYLLLLNSDAELLDGAPSRMIDFMDKHANVGIVGASLRNADGSRQFDCDLFPLTPWQRLYQLLIDKINPHNQHTRRARIARWTYEAPFEVDWVLGAALMIRRATMEQAGLLDERFFMYAEDIDWCYRVKQIGWKVFYLPDVAVYHKRHGSSPEMPDHAGHVNKRADQSLLKFYRKHYGPIAAAGLYLINLQRDMALQLAQLVRH